MEVVSFMLVATVVLILTAAMFGGWVLVVTSRGVLRLLGYLTGAPAARRPELAATTPGHVRCPRARCRAENPSVARYCRRCGKPVAASAPKAARVRRAAML